MKTPEQVMNELQSYWRPEAFLAALAAGAITILVFA